MMFNSLLSNIWDILLVSIPLIVTLAIAVKVVCHSRKSSGKLEVIWSILQIAGGAISFILYLFTFEVLWIAFTLSFIASLLIIGVAIVFEVLDICSCMLHDVANLHRNDE